MNRRRLLKLAALAGVAAAGAGYWALPAGEAPGALSHADHARAHVLHLHNHLSLIRLA